MKTKGGRTERRRKRGKEERKYRRKMQEIHIVIYSSLLLSIMICENIIQRMETIKQKYKMGTKKKENMKMSKEPALS